MHESITIPGLVKQLLSAGETTKSLAVKLGVSQPTVSRLATGETRDTSWGIGVRIWLAAGGQLTPPTEVVDQPAGRPRIDVTRTPDQITSQETRDAA
jgi:transcriptional regulator with XRE-family HTH domain